MLLDVATLFDAEVKKQVVDLDLQRFVLTHERKSRCIGNLSLEILKAETALGTRFQKRHLDLMIESIARLFIDNVIRHRDEEVLSEAEKNRRAKGQKTEDQLIGELNELGCEIKSTEEVQDKKRDPANPRPEGSGIHQ